MTTASPTAAAVNLPRHRECTREVTASPDALFAYLDDHRRLTGHMGRRSWMMAGGKMNIDIDGGTGQRVGSHIRMAGTVLGLRIELDEVVTAREPGRAKAWETVGAPRLLVIGPYRMGFRLAPGGQGTRLTVFIDYDLPAAAPWRWLGLVLAAPYADWCVTQMANDAVAAFAGRAHST